MSQDALSALRRAVEALPQDVELRVHLAQAELQAGEAVNAIATLAQAVVLDPQDSRVRELMSQALAVPTAGFAGQNVPSTPMSGTVDRPIANERKGASESAPSTDFDWDAAEQDGDWSVPAAFLVGESGTSCEETFTPDRPTISLEDVAGMASVKERLVSAFLAPMQNPKLRRLYRKSLRGGLLMYGPPGCGKTHIARAMAGELGAGFLPVGIADVLDQWIGASEQNIHRIFMQARRDAPCMVFIDELDTLGGRRSNAGSLMSGVINQLLTELDGVSHSNEGVFILASTNQPWEVDPALRRPGRFDRTILVLPPDIEARKELFRLHVTDRPVEDIDVALLAAKTDGFSGADIAYVCEAGAERALVDSIQGGEPRLITMADLLAVVATTRPSIGQWLDTARNIVTYGHDDGTFSELKSYLKKSKWM